jgi:AraC-like DNA-binding protein
MERKLLDDAIDPLSPRRTVTELRAVVDVLAARCAAARVARGADFGPLIASFRRLQRTARAGDDRRMDEADCALHLAIASLAEVPALEDVWQAIAAQQEAFRHESRRNCWPDLNVLAEAHRPIVDAICAGSQSAAEDAVRAHSEAVWYRMAGQRGDRSLPGDPLAQACAYVAFNLHEPIRLGSLARDYAHTSPGHLARLFRAQYGVGFTTYLRQLRLRKALELLTRSRLPIALIARRVGYRDGSRFAQHFRRQFGMTPRECRRRFVPTEHG